MTLFDVAKHLEALESNDEKFVTPWTPEQRQLHDAEKEYKGPSIRMAYIAYEGRCGFASSGSMAYVVNRLNNKSVRATVRVNWRQGLNSGQYDVVKSIPAGSRVFVGCTSGNGVGGGDFAYTVVGTEEL